jgi:hypothetical protein
MTDANLMEANCVHGVVWYECKECSAQQEAALLGLATTDALFNELIARFDVNAQSREFESILNSNRVRTLSNMRFGLSMEEKLYRTVDS